jgi:CDP-diacylglycerol---serine O-phosphatidyltransferase
MSDPITELFPPFQPDSDEPKKRRFQPVPLRVLLPNMVTLLALCLGLTAIRLAIEGRIDAAVYAILFAAVLDGIDGNLARYLKGTSRFGAELDSLADFVNFGCVPALVLYFWILKDMKSLRLARFNVMLDDPNRPEWKKGFFVGMPAPMGAACVLLPLYATLGGLLPVFTGLPLIVLIYTLLIAFFTISTIPTISSKKLSQNINRSYVIPIFVCAVLVVGLLISHTFEVLTGGVLLYLASLPFGMRRYRALEKAWIAQSPAEPATTVDASA